MNGQLNRSVVRNVVVHAFEYTGKPGRIAIGVQKDAERLTCRFGDNGVAPTSDRVQRAFDIITRFASAEAPAGSALGLRPAKKVIELHKRVYPGDQ